MLRLLIRIPYLVFWIAGFAALAAACWMYVTSLTIVMGYDHNAPGVSSEFVDLGAFEQAVHMGPRKDFTVMAQINDLVDGNLGLVADREEPIYAYFLFPAIAAPDEKLVRAAIVTSERARMEEWLRERIIGNAQMGALYTIPGFRVDDRRLKAAVIGRLSELGFSSAAEFTVIRPAYEVPPEKNYVAPPKAKLIVPILLITFSGLFLIVGFHLRSMQARARDEDAVDPILAVDPVPEGED